MRDSLSIYTVYENPSDFPGRFVCRIHRVFSGGEQAPDSELFANEATLRAVREKLPPGLVCLKRHPGDDTTIVEVWL